MSATKRLWRILTPRQRRDAIILLLMMVIGMMLEMLGIGLILPALALMTHSAHGTLGSGIAASFHADTLRRLLGAHSPAALVVLGMSALVAVYALKALFLAFLTWREMRFVYGAQADISHRLFLRYLRQPYAFHLHRNSALLIRNATTEVQVFCTIFLAQAFILLTEGLVLVGIAIVLLIVEPRGTLIIVACVAALVWAFHRATHASVRRWGVQRHEHDGKRIQCLQHGLGGIKDVLLLGREREFLQQYQVHNLGSARAGGNHETLHQMPRLGLELIAVSVLAGYVITRLRYGTPLEAIVPTIGLFAAAALRIMPSVNRVLNSAHNVQYALPALSVLTEELALPAGPLAGKADAIPLRHEIRLSGIGYTYPGARDPSLSGISLKVRRGSTVGVIGGSGAGKSTLVNVLLGLLMPDAGRVEIDGIDIATNLRGWQRAIGYVPQSIFLTDDSLRRNIAFGIAAEHIDEAAVWKAVRAAQLEEHVRSLPEGLDTLVGERGVRLSGGQLQRVGIARALYHNPEVLVLDEATSSLDFATEQGVLRSVRALHGQKTIIIVAHRPTTLQDCDWIFRLEQGRLAAEGAVATMLPVPDRSNLERAAAGSLAP